jgi:hypothetical protein
LIYPKNTVGTENCLDWAGIKSKTGFSAGIEQTSTSNRFAFVMNDSYMQALSELQFII